MGLFGGGNASTTAQEFSQAQDGDGNKLGVVGGSNVTASERGVAGNSNEVNEAQDDASVVSLNGSNSSSINFGTSLAANHDLNVQIQTDQGAINSALSAVDSAVALVSAASDRSADTVSAALDNQGKLISQAFQTQADQASGGQLTSNKSFLWLVGGLLAAGVAVAGLIVWAKK